VGSTQRLAAFNEAVRRLLDVVARLPEGGLGKKLETATPRDLLARLIVWNRRIQDGCRTLSQGKTPAYFSDAVEGYAEVQTEAARQFGQLDRRGLTEELTASKEQLVAYLSDLESTEWNRDRGFRHPEGGPATVLRELEGLTRRYLDAADEISLWLDSTSTT